METSGCLEYPKRDLASCSQSLSPNPWILEAFEVQGKSLFQKAFEECEGVVEEFSTHR